MRIPWRLVVDTNVVLDLFHFKRPGTEPITHLIESGEALCFACLRTLIELQHVIPREHFRLDAEAAQTVFERYCAHTIVVADPEDMVDLPQCKDASDQKFLALAVSVAAEYLLTRDKQLLRLAKRVSKVSALKIMTPEKFIAACGVEA